ncbi:hypothetical protein GXP71_12060 [Cellulomonas sp. H30R-01]|uniref:hypothetical protein n=1 Tax=Cellulomonas sp. H30R-01 TaxID=2704467 RepID=UPI00138B62FA|nr:hypothetical protein [Cellulomonas sp. H30R-01]QHT56741.1 hypothetical protein GXP71_12060 [Cellulomonas sp. H30R-01]
MTRTVLDHCDRPAPGRVARPDHPATARRRTAFALPAVGLVLLLAACSGAAGDAGADPTASAPADGGGAGPQTQRVDEPGRVVGEIVSVDTALVQVRATDEQTAVTWSDTTTFTQTVAGTLADVAVGSCVVAVATPTGDTTASDDTSDTPLDATTVTITAAADDGTCTGVGGFGGPGGGGGGLPGGAPTDLPTELPSGAPWGDDDERPDGAPTDLPSGAPMTRAFGGVVSGQVTGVSGTTLTVSVTSGPGESDDDGSSDEPVDRQVVVSDATTYIRTVDADASALTVGRCAAVRGEADDSGKVAATSVQVSDPTDDGCTSALGGMVMRGGPGGMPGGVAQDEEGTDA